jgi:hypothetical protein
MIIERMPYAIFIKGELFAVAPSIEEVLSHCSKISEDHDKDLHVELMQAPAPTLEFLYDRSLDKLLPR